MENFGKTAVFPGGYGNTTRADMAGLGSIGLKNMFDLPHPRNCILMPIEDDPVNGSTLKIWPYIGVCNSLNTSIFQTGNCAP